MATFKMGGVIIVTLSLVCLVPILVLTIFTLNRPPGLQQLPATQAESATASSDIPQEVHSDGRVVLPEPTGYELLMAANTKTCTLNAYDSANRHTGLVSNPDPTSEFPLIQEGIPNSGFAPFGEKIYLTLDTTDEYRVQIHRSSPGVCGIELKLGTETFAYPEITVSPDGRALLVLPRGGFRVPPELQIDLDGDGRIDLRQKADVFHLR